MQIAYTLSLAQQTAAGRYGAQRRVVGLMLANYEAKLVKDTLARCYAAWDYEAQEDLDIYWLGYSQYVYRGPPASKRLKSTFVVNFNQAADAQPPHRLADCETPEAFEALLKRLDNPTCVAFDRLAYLDSKREIRARTSLNKEQKIDSMTLLFAEYYDGRFHLEDGNCLAVNLHALKDSPDPVTDINDLVSAIIAHCRTAHNFGQLLKKIKKELPQNRKSADVKSWVSIGVSILSLLLK